MIDILRRLHCTIRCDIETAKSGCHCAEGRDTITALRAEVEDLGNRLHHVHRLWANNEHALRAENERLRAALRLIADDVGAGTWQGNHARAALGDTHE